MQIVGNRVVKFVVKSSEKMVSIRVNGSEEYVTLNHSHEKCFFFQVLLIALLNRVFFGEWLSSKFYARMLSTIGGDSLYGASPLEATQVCFVNVWSSPHFICAIDVRL